MRIQNGMKTGNFGRIKIRFALVWNVPENARTINLPHDAMIERKSICGGGNHGNTGFRDRGVCSTLSLKHLFARRRCKKKNNDVEI